MSDNLRLTLVVIGAGLMLIVLALVARKRVPVKYSLFWFFSSITIVLVGAVPQFVGLFTSALGFETTSNLVIGIIVGLLLLTTLLLTVIISDQKKTITLLVQELSLLKSGTPPQPDDSESDQ